MEICESLDVGVHHKATGFHQSAPHPMHSLPVHHAWQKGLVARAKPLCNTNPLLLKETACIQRLLSARRAMTYAAKF